MTFVNKSRVVIVKSPRVLDSAGNVNEAVLTRMVDQALFALSGEKNRAAAWRAYFNPRDVVGLKVNSVGGKALATRPQLTKTVIAGLESMGIAPRNTVVWDREFSELKRAGYNLNFSGGGPRCYGTDTKGAGFDDELIIYKNIASLFSRILTTHTTATLNMPVLKDHGQAGLTFAMKNYYGAIHNPNKYHEDGCSPYVADLAAVPLVRQREKLILADALAVQYNGGPGYKPYWNEKYGAVLAAADPVAMDTVGLKIVEELRKKYGLPSLGQEERFPQYLKIAAGKEHRVGNGDWGKIEIVEIAS